MTVMVMVMAVDNDNDGYLCTDNIMPGNVDINDVRSS